MNIRVLGNRLLVRRIAAPDVTKGGLWIVGRELPAIATVLAVGSGPRSGRWGRGARRPITDVQVGDEVTFDKWAAENRTFGPENDLLILNYDECFLRIRKE